MKLSLRAAPRALLRCLAAALALLALAALALPAGADEGDLDEITRYTVTVETRADGTADITYEIEWSVIGGSADEPLTWVRIGLPNRYNDGCENLTPDTVSEVTLEHGSDGAFARVTFAQPYYAPDAAAENGGASRVDFAFRVHQSHLFLLNEDGNADYSFTPGWFDDLCVDSLTVRWLALDGMEAPDAQREGDYWVWSFGPLQHGEKAAVEVTVPARAAQDFDPDAAADKEPRYTGSANLDWLWPVLYVVLILLVSCYIANRRAQRRWRGGFGGGDPGEWDWYTNGTETIRVVHTMPPPEGFRPAAPPKSFRAGGGSTRGGGAGRRSGSGRSKSSSEHHSSCACACACVSSCACACACAGGGRAGCSAKNFYRITVKKAD